ncbi:MAG TPA: sigma-70 family RNA polymerase sigma factor [Candidatus Polarisedimenticolia bacterium]|nr:sigma-70 family RNA polymerase sigma factor [Candidatus Polarisedimenticolia bacterium]
MPSEPTDVELIREVLAGRVELFEILVRRYQRLVATAALRMGVARQEVEDVANEVFYKVFRNLKRYEPRHALSTWLYRITVNAALDHKRGRRHDALAEEVPASLADNRPSPHDEADEEQRARLLQEALGRIPGHYRAPLVLAHIEGLSVDEVARILDLPEGTVKSRLFRARAMLKAMIRRHYPSLAPIGGAGEDR